jgi:Pectate lyase superfamily protein
MRKILFLALLLLITLGFKKAKAADYLEVVNVKTYGAIENDGLDDRTAIQAAINASNPGTVGSRITWFPPGTYHISGPLRLHANGILRGPAQIVALPTFIFPDDLTAMLIFSPGGQDYHLGKMQIDQLVLNGADITGSRGFLAALQQQSTLDRFYVRNCQVWGMRITGQQAVFQNLEITNNTKGIWFDGAQFMWFFGLNSENNGVHLDFKQGPNSGSNDNYFFGSHVESNGTHDIFADIYVAQNLLFDGIRNTMDKPNHTHFRANSPGPHSYRIKDWYGSTSITQATFLSDTVRGITLKVWDDFRGRANDIIAPAIPSSDTYSDAGPIRILGKEGRYIHMGGTVYNVPSIDLKPSSVQTAPLIQIRNTSGVVVGGISHKGVSPARLPTAPSGVPPGTVFFDTAIGKLCVFTGTTWEVINSQ